MEMLKFRKLFFKDKDKKTFTGLWKWESAEIDKSYDQAILGDAAAYVPGNGYVVIDADGIEATNFVEKIIRINNLNVFSYTSCGGSGRHFIFKVPKDMEDKLTSISGVSPFQGKEKHSGVDVKGNQKGIVYFYKKNMNDKPQVTEEDLINGFENAPMIPLILTLNFKGWKKPYIKINSIDLGNWNKDAMMNFYSPLKVNNFSEEESKKITYDFLKITNRDTSVHMQEFKRDFNNAFMRFEPQNNISLDLFNAFSKINKEKIKGKSEIWMVNGVRNFEIIAKYICDKVGFKRSSEDGQVWGFNGNVFGPIISIGIIIKRELINAIKNISPNIFSNIIAYVDGYIPQHEINKNPFYISFLNNKNFNINDKEYKISESASFEGINQNILPHKIDNLNIKDIDIEDKEFFDKMMAGWSNYNKQLEKELYELIGFSMIKYTDKDILYFLTGTGNNGKSLFLKFLGKILGINNVSFIGIDEISTDKFASANLYGRLANVNADISSDNIKNTTWLKRITSGDVIRGQNKNNHSFNFAPYATQIYAANEIPFVSEKGNSNGFLRRVKVIPFNNIFLEDIEKKKIEKTKKLYTKDVFKYAIIKSMKAINHALNHGFTNSNVSKKTKEEYMKEINHMFNFVEERKKIKNDEAALVVYKEYVKWCYSYNYKNIYGYDHFIKKYINAMGNIKKTNVIKMSYENEKGKDRHRFIIIDEE